jgi:hypothetical protein
MIVRFRLPRCVCVPTALTALALLAAISLPAYAQLDWELRISEKEQALAHSNDTAWMNALQYDKGFTRMWHRNMPAIELSNTSTAGSPDIERFELLLRDIRFNFSDDHFGEFAPLGSTTPGFILDSSVADGGNRLIVEISKPDGTGLAVGEVVRFNIQLGVDPGFNFFSHPDFRTVLFDMNGCEVYDGNTACGNFDSSDNAQATAIFADGTEVGPKTFADEVVSGNSSLYFNGTFPRHSTPQGIDEFGLDGGFVIPEPAGALLAVVGWVSGLLLAPRRRR